jgi:hypothetical protein
MKDALLVRFVVVIAAGVEHRGSIPCPRVPLSMRVALTLKGVGA